MAILLKNLTISNSQKDVLIDKGLIQRIEPVGSCLSWDLAGELEVMDCTDKIAIPGFVNMHTHSAMSMMRGIGEDMVFEDWLSKIWKVEERIDPEYVYWSTKVACIEMIRTGTTTFNDQYWFFDASQKAAQEMGLRIATGYDIIDHGKSEEAARIKDECEKAYEQYGTGWSDGSIYEIAFHAIYSVSEPSILYAAEFARKHKLKLHIHLCETRGEVESCRQQHGGLTPVEYLERLGVLGPNVLAAHTLWLTENDVRILADRKVNCIHNINSNTKLASGYKFLYNELRDAGANICLGTDGCASSNNLDMLEAMKTSALFQKSWRDDPSAMPLPELLDMATVNGAKALGLNTGLLEEGRIADITIMEANSTYFLSPGPFLANLVYSSHSDCIDSVIAGGRFVMRGRRVEGESEIIREAKKCINKIIA